MRRTISDPVLAACLALSLLVVGANLAVGAPAQGDAATASHAPHPLVGSWRFTAPGAPGTPPEDPTLVMFGPDGTVVVSGRAVRPALPGRPWRLTYFSTGLGTWQPTGDGSAAFTVVHLVSDERGELRGTATVSGILQIGADGESATGRETFKVAGPDSTVQAAFPVARTAGARIALEPMAEPAPVRGCPECGPTPD